MKGGRWKPEAPFQTAAKRAATPGKPKRWRLRATVDPRPTDSELAKRAAFAAMVPDTEYVQYMQAMRARIVALAAGVYKP